MNIKEYVFNMPTGSILPVVTRQPGSSIEEVSFIIKEGKYNLDKIGIAPNITVRGGVIKGDTAAAMVSMFSFNDMPFRYDTWFDYCSMFGRTAIDRLINQESILFDCVDVSGKTVQQFRISNRLAKLARNYSIISSDYCSWESHEYFALKGVAFKNFNSNPEELWETLAVH